MSNQNLQPISWKEILRVNALGASGVVATFYGWLCWQMATSPEWWGFWIAAVLSLLGGVIQLFRTLYATNTAIRSHRLWKTYGGKGVDPRADEMVSEQEMKKRGYM